MSKIFACSSVHIWTDTRVFHKEAVSLSKKYSVEYHAIADFEKKVINDNLTVFGLKKPKNRLGRIKLWFQLWKRLKKSDAEIVHFSCPELVFFGACAKIFLKKKIIFDVHEDFPENIKEKVYLNKTAAHLFSYLYRFSEFLTLRFFDLIIYTTKLNGLRYHKYPHQKIENYPLIEQKYIDMAERTKKEKKVVYLGFLHPDRNCREFIQAFNKLSPKYPEWKFILVGPNPVPEYVEEVNREIEKNPEKVKWLGRLENYDDCLLEVARSMVGLIAHKRTGNFKTHLPNKLFEYPLMKVPPIITNFPLYKEIVDDGDWGFIIEDSHNLDEIIEKMDNAMSNPARLLKMGEIGQKKILEKYNWTSEEKLLFKRYQELLDE